MKTSEIYQLLMKHFNCFSIEQEGRGNDIADFIKEALTGIGGYNDFLPELVYENLMHFLVTYYPNSWISISIGRSSSPEIKIRLDKWSPTAKSEQVEGALDILAQTILADEFSFKKDSWWFEVWFWWD